MKDSLRDATRLLGVYTAGRFDVWNLAGPAKASCRAHVMSALLGVKTPQSKSGVNAMRDAFYAAIRDTGAVIDGECIAERENRFIEWCRRIDAPRGQSELSL